MSPRAPRPSWTVVPESIEAGLRLPGWLARRFPNVAEEVWEERIRRGLVIDAAGAPLTAETPCEPHLRIGYFREVVDEPEGPRVEILSVDDHLIVVDKPHFLPVTPSGRFVERCVLYQVERRLGLRDLAPLHRLDRHTAGLVLLGRVSSERGRYGSMFANREIDRLYEAVARLDGGRGRARWSITSRIEPDGPSFRMREVEGESNAETEIELVADHRTPGEASGWGVFRLRPKTGKKHQLRLHMTSIGCPIAGDRLYPELLPERPDDQVPPLSLIAAELSFPDPVTGEERRYVSRRTPTVPETPPEPLRPPLSSARPPEPAPR